MGAGAGMSNFIGSNTGQIQLINGQVPGEGPRAVPVLLDLTTTTQGEVDFTLAAAQARLTAVQCVWVDNSENPSELIIAAQASGQRIRVPRFSQGTFPVLGAIPPKFAVSSGGGVAIQTVWLNVPVPVNEWRTDTLFSPAGGLTHTVAVGGTAVNAFGISPAGGGYITNPFGASESLFVDPVNPAGTSAPGTYGTTSELVPGQTYPIQPGLTGPVTVNAVTSAHAFTVVGFSTPAVGSD